MLRPYRQEDAPADAAATEHPSSARWLNVHSSGDAAADVRAIEGARIQGQALTLAIADENDDRYLGAVVLFIREPGTGELAYLVVPDARGRGLAWRAVDGCGVEAMLRLMLALALLDALDLGPIFGRAVRVDLIPSLLVRLVVSHRHTHETIPPLG